MISLVFKDFRITRLFWLPAMFSYLVFLLMAYEVAWVMLLIGISLVLVMSALLLLVDDVHRADVLYGALPVTRRDIVLARYLTVGVVTAIALALFYLGTSEIIALLGEKGFHLRPLLSFRTAVAFVSVVGLSMSVFLPLFFRFGLGRAVLRFLIVLLGGSVVLTAALQLFGADLVSMLNRGIGAAGGPPASGPALVPALLAGIESSLGGIPSAALALAVTAMAVAVSARTSIRIYRRRDL